MSKHTTHDTEATTSGPVLTQEELAKRWDCTVRTVQNYRKSGKGPRYMLVGFSPRYLLSEIEAYEQSQQQEPGVIRDMSKARESTPAPDIGRTRKTKPTDQ